MKRWTTAILPIVLLAAALPAAAAPFAVRLGLEQIVLDAPPGFSDTTNIASPRLQDIAASLTSASNRVLLFALTDADLRRFTVGDPLDAKKRYLIAYTPKAMERERINSDQLAVLVSESLRELGKPAQAADLVKFLESQPVGHVHLLAELKKEPAIVSVMQASRLQPLPGATFWESEKPQYLLFTNSFVLLRGKALLLSVFTLFDGPADTEWLKFTTQRWVDELQRLNSR